MPNTRSRRGTPTSQGTPADTHLRHLTTEVLRLRLGQFNLVTTGSQSALLARLTTALKDRPKLPQPTNGNYPKRTTTTKCRQKFQNLLRSTANQESNK